MQVADIYMIARRLFLKSSISKNQKRVRLFATKSNTSKVMPDPNKRHGDPHRPERVGRLAARGTRDLLPWRRHRGPPTASAAPRCGEAAGVAKAQRAEPRQGLLAPYAPQPSDEPIGSELGRGVRVVAAGAAGAGVFFSGAQVVFGQMVAPEARTEHKFGHLGCAERFVHPRTQSVVRLILSTRGDCGT